MSKLDYWKECISIASEECGLILTYEQLNCLSGSVELGHANYGQAFYSPPASDCIAVINNEWKEKYNQLEVEFNEYRKNANTAVKIALRQYSDEQITIEKNGAVYRIGGRIERIQ